MDQKPVNPLRAHFRQPAIYLQLPSRGQFWGNGLNLPEVGELPIYPMTAKDEILLKTPDALLNGQGVVDVIQSCCPNIVDAWQMPGVDVDPILIAIRIASYGSEMPVDTTCPHCGAENTFDIDLNAYLDNVILPDYSKKIDVDHVRIKPKPQNYASINETNKINYEEQRILENIGVPDSEDQGKLDAYKKHLNRLIKLNAKLLVDTTEYIELPESGTVVSDPEFIEEFYFNCDAEICKELQSRLVEINKEGAVKPQTGECTSCSGKYDISLLFDYASFFGKRS
jgi:hypothetical protein